MYNSKVFRSARAEENAKRLRWVAMLYIGLVAWFITLNVVAYAGGTRDYPPELFHAVLYLALLYINIYVVLRVKARPVDNTKDIRRDEWFVSGYIFLIMTIGAGISLADQPAYGHLSVYIMNMLICSSFFLTSIRQILSVLGLSSIIMFAGLPLVVYSPVQLTRFYQELFTYLPVSYFVSRVVYKAFCDQFASNTRLTAEMQKNDELNQRLKETNQCLHEANQSLEVANTRLAELALEDELTGIPNRRGFYDYLDDQLTNNGRPGRDFIVIMIDVDYFKEYNDHYGHVRGDEILIRLARNLSRVAEETSGFICRWGGEEFLYIAPDQGQDDAVEICKRIFNSIAALKIPHERSLASRYVSLSIGAVSSVVNSTEDIIASIQQADGALYSVKEKGRNGYRVVAAINDIDTSLTPVVVSERRAK